MCYILTYMKYQYNIIQVNKACRVSISARENKDDLSQLTLLQVTSMVFIGKHFFRK